MPIAKRPLGLIMDVVETLNIDVTYAYDNLIFIEHNALLLRMEDDPGLVSLFFNTEAKTSEHARILSTLSEAGIAKGITINYKGLFSLADAGDEKIEIRFVDTKE